MLTDDTIKDILSRLEKLEQMFEELDDEVGELDGIVDCLIDDVMRFDESIKKLEGEVL